MVVINHQLASSYSGSHTGEHQSKLAIFQQAFVSRLVSVLQLVDGPAVIEVVGDAVDIEAGGTAED